ncbi:MAG: hypothetical protein KAG94_00120 [Clostridiales bacterium]|nr:hypothetical protein [Clostridiales bacterium]
MKWAAFFKVSTSGYYEWVKILKIRKTKEEDYEKKVIKIFFSGESTCGVDRVCGKMREKGYKASYNKVKRILDKNNLHSIHKKKRSRSLTDSKKARGDEYNNIVKDLEITEPFQVVTSDIS